MEHINEIDDRWSRLVGIPGFGISIPLLTGLFGPLGVRDARTWLGFGWFILLAAVIWQGNRWLLFRQRERLDWFTRPVGKLVFLVVGCVFYTAPVTVGMLLLWYRFADIGPVDWDIVRAVALTNVICVLFVTHVYETAFLIKARVSDRLTVASLKRAQAEAELAALRTQIDPHFLFNSLNTLAWLIPRDPDGAVIYNGRLAQVYRYILANRERSLVQLGDEIEFVTDCFHLLEVRFGEALRLHLPPPATDPLARSRRDRLLLPPISLQVLLENAVKHNEFSVRAPLDIHLDLGDGWVEVRNDLRPRRSPAEGEQVGLANLSERYRLLLEEDIDVRRSAHEFAVRLPLIQVGRSEGRR